MNCEDFAVWQRRQGYKVFRTENCYWYNSRPGFYFNFPYHRLINPDKNELNKLLWGIPCLGIRYFTPIEYPGKSSYMIVCSDKNYDLSSVDAKNARRQTRRGLENFRIKQLDFNELANNNSINVDTLIRQGRNPGIWTEKKWNKFCFSCEGVDGLEAWGAFFENSLAAFIMAYQMDDYFYIFHHSSATKFLQLYPNNALVFYITRLKLRSYEVNHISYGPQSLDAPDSLETFKFRMGFQKQPMKQRIIFHPLIRPFINGFTYRLIQKIAIGNADDFWRKLEGILRFYLEVS